MLSIHSLNKNKKLNTLTLEAKYPIFIFTSLNEYTEIYGMKLKFRISGLKIMLMTRCTVTTNANNIRSTNECYCKKAIKDGISVKNSDHIVYYNFSKFNI